MVLGVKLLVIIIASTDNQGSFQNQSHKDPWEHSQTPNALPCFLHQSQEKSQKAEQVKELRQ